MSFSVTNFLKSMLMLFVATTLLSSSLLAKEMTQQERNEMAAKLIPIISILLMSDEDTTSNTQSLKKTGQTTIYYNFDDGHYEKGVTPNYTRNATTEVVTDHITGLEWQDDSDAKTITKNWADAQSYCSALGLDGGGWRLPSRKELVGLSDYGRINPAINPVFSNVASNGYWSSTTYAGDSRSTWNVNFDDGYPFLYFKGNSSYVRCVRAGQ